MRNLLVHVLLVLLLASPALGSNLAAWPSETGGASGGGDSGMFEFCRQGGQGVGFNEATGRWAATCGNFNWHGYQDSTQANASYYVDCTGDGEGTLEGGGSPTARQENSCLRSGEKRLIGALHRVGLAAYYTDDGGIVYLPRFAGKDHGIYVDIGCGIALDGTTQNECPDPYDPTIEADANFSSKGYHWRLHNIGVQRGVRIIGEGKPLVDDAASDNPKLKGVWLVNDRGQSRTSSRPACTTGDECNDGPGLAADAPNFFFRVGYVEGLNRCELNPRGNNSIACDNDVSQNFTPDNYLQPSISSFGARSEIVGNWVNTNNFDTMCMSNAFGKCVGGSNANAPCNDNTPCTGGGTCNLSKDSTTGTCRGDRDIVCWAASDTAANGGCQFDLDSDTVFETDLGPCEGFVDALAYDNRTLAPREQLSVLVFATHCEPNASSSTDCLDGGTGNAYGTGGWIVSPRDFVGTQCGGSGVVAEQVRLGGDWSDGVEGWAAANNDTFAATLPYDTWYSDGFGGTQANALFAVSSQRFNLKDAGASNVGFMPAHWLYRDSTKVGNKCVSNNDESASNDEHLCDSQSLVQLGIGSNGRMSGNFHFNASSDSRSGQIDGSGVVARHVVERSTFMYNRRGLISDMGSWLLRDNIWERNWYSGNGFIAFAAGLRIDGDRFLHNGGNGPLWNLGSNTIENVNFNGITFEGNGARSNPLIQMTRVQNFALTNSQVIGGGYALMHVLNDVDINSIKIDNVAIRGLEAGTQVNSDYPYSIILVAPQSPTNHVNALTVSNVWLDGLDPPVAGYCFIWADLNLDEGDLASWWLSGNTVLSNDTATRFYCYGDGVDGDFAHETPADRDLDGPAPPMSANAVNNSIEGAAPWPSGMAAADTGDCQNHNAGTIVQINDDTAAGACTDAGADGILDGGGSAKSVCVCDPAGDTGDGAWAALSAW